MLIPKEIDFYNQFINDYESIYYLDEENLDKKPVIVGLGQSCRWIEEDMEGLLWNREREWKPTDVVHLLAWKMGRINHKESIRCKSYCFTGMDEKTKQPTWSDKGELKAKNRSGEIEIEQFAKNVLKFKEEYERKKDYFCEHPEEMLASLKDTAVKGIGSVYLVTILYFVSGGKYPIYDQFAMLAMKAIKDGGVPGKEYPIQDLPDRKSAAFTRLLSNPDSVYLDYIDNLKTLSEELYNDKDAYQKTRKIDQALWVYGHLFNRK